MFHLIFQICSTIGNIAIAILLFFDEDYSFAIAYSICAIVSLVLAIFDIEELNKRNERRNN